MNPATTKGDPRPGRPEGPPSADQVPYMISLLLDESASVVSACHKGLVQNADVAEPQLRARLEEITKAGVGGDAAGDAATAVTAVLSDVVAARLEEPLIEAVLGGADLEVCSVLLSRLVDPDLVLGDGDDVAARVRAQLDAMADEVAEDLLGNADPDKQLGVLVEVLYQRHDMRGADPSKATLSEATLHGTLTTGRGLPLPLSIVWLLVARRVDVPLEALNMPAHFLLRHRHPESDRIIDPYHGGRVIPHDNCRRILSRAGFPSDDVDQLACGDAELILRTLRNLVMISGRLGRRFLQARCSRVLGRLGEQLGP